MRIREDKQHRDVLFARLLGTRPRSGWPHQHELWPCVRRGAAERFLLKRGVTLEKSRLRALYFLRGMSAEAVITRSWSNPVFVAQGVAIRPDWLLGMDEEYPFAEVKSTVMSSLNIWNALKRGEIDLLGATDIPLRNYYEQCAIYCTALGIKRCKLIVFFLHGDYADRRKNCPSCNKGKLGPFVDDLYRVCDECGFKSHKADLRVYQLVFSDEEIAWYQHEVFERRLNAFLEAEDAETPEELREAAPGTRGFMCRGCEPGRIIECEHYA